MADIDPQLDCRLLQLPAELRDQIYRLLLAPDHLSTLRRISARGYCSDYVLPPLSLTPGLLQTCRQINVEATPVLYGCNTFAAHTSMLTDMPYLVTHSRPILNGRGKPMIRRWYVNVRLDIDPRYDAEKVKKAFSGVEVLEIDVFQAMYGSCDLSALSLFEGIRGVRMCRIHGSIGDGRYARKLEEMVTKPIGYNALPDEDMIEHRSKSTGRSAELRSQSDVWTGNR